jgi:predicted nucleotidyltransferase
MGTAEVVGVEVPERFVPALRAVAGLAADERYVGALIFGSVALGTAGDASDFDVRVVVGEDNPCSALNHPRVGGVKLDITFRSLRQLEQELAEEIAEGGGHR